MNILLLSALPLLSCLSTQLLGYYHLCGPFHAAHTVLGGSRWLCFCNLRIVVCVGSISRM